MPLSIHRLRVNRAYRRALVFLVVVLFVLGKAAPLMALPVANAAVTDGNSPCLSVAVHASMSSAAAQGASADFNTPTCCDGNGDVCDAHCTPLLAHSPPAGRVLPLFAGLTLSTLTTPALRVIEPPRRPPRI